MLINIKQVTLKHYIFIVLLSSLFIGCTNKILYHPPKNNIPLTQQYHYDERNISTVDKELLSAVEYYTPEEKSQGVLLFLHGNADNIYSAQNTGLLFLEGGYNVLLVDYRGYGKSTGKPSPKGLNLDIQAMIQYLNKEYDNIYIYAQSIGGTSFLGALDEIDKSKIRAITTEGSFFSYKQLADKMGIHIPFTNYKELMSYAPISTKETSIPLLIIHSTEDEIIPYSQGLALSQHFKKAKHLPTTGKHLGYLSSSFKLKQVFRFFNDNKNYKYITPIENNISNENNVSISVQ
ncbi:MAG: Unknown protein [uncultured Sulfurovum sp.]|uniref:AB hydrolase-1 domain-containing protein n=1 Tax=uncultured Sulfurovum sp. TaxID=269237 RepID=A0A6S6S2H2_9BACT|nr:MAG: Unknown protein [uncultured Sulfurovum sp.]